MKFKALRRIDNKEFIHLGDNYAGYEISVFTSEMPKLMGADVTMNDIIKHCGGKFHECVIQEWELVELEIKVVEDEDKDAIGADIRNKLTPIKNLIALLKAYDAEKNEGKRFLMKAFIIGAIENSEISLNYLQDLL